MKQTMKRSPRLTPSKPNRPPMAQWVIGVAVLSQAVGCSTVSSLISGDSVDYRSAKKVPTLEVPPDLTQLAKDNRFNVPAADGTPAVTSYNALQNNGAGAASANNGGSGSTGARAAVLPTRSDVRIERSGDQRWLVIDQPPEKVYALVRDFWQDNGFLIRLDLPEAGVMETDWAENRAKIPQGVVRDALSKVLDSIYSTGERDKFRTRIERLDNGSSEIYITHKGMEEKLVGSAKDQTLWENRPRDPGLETEFLQRLMVRFGYDIDRAKAQLAAAPSAAPGVVPGVAPGVANAAVVMTGETGQYTGFKLPMPFDRAWRQVGLALDRASFTVEDRDRNQGVYFVRYLPPENEMAKPGFFSRLLGSGTKSDKAETNQQYQVKVKTQDGSSNVEILAVDAAAQTTKNKAVISRMVELIKAQL